MSTCSMEYLMNHHQSTTIFLLCHYLKQMRFVLTTDQMPLEFPLYYWHVSHSYMCSALFKTMKKESFLLITVILLARIQSAQGCPLVASCCPCTIINLIYTCYIVHWAIEALNVNPSLITHSVKRTKQLNKTHINTQYCVNLSCQKAI